MRPRILQVLFSYQIGGSEVFGFELANRLTAAGVEVLCAALFSQPGPLSEQCARAGIPTLDLGISTVNPLTRNGLSPGLVRQLRALRLDAIHLQHFLGLHKVGLPARLAGVRRIVVTEHSVHDIGQSFAGRFRARLDWRLASNITVVHRSIRDYLCGQLGLPYARVQVVPVGVDVNAYERSGRARVRSQLGISADEPTLIFVGRLAPVKNVPGLISAFLGALDAQARPARLIVVGEGEDRGACEAVLSAHPLRHRVHMVGQQVDITPYLAASDLFILNSRTEGTPRALLEAMAMGLPAISPAVGGIPDMLAENRGWLMPAGNRQALEDAIVQALADPACWPQKGSKSRDYVRTNFDAARIAEQYRQLLLG